MSADVRFADFGPVAGVGLIRDVPGHELPPGAWSAGQNVRFLNAAVMSGSGYQPVFSAAPLAIAPQFLLPVGNRWIYCGLNQVYATDQNSHAEITRAAGGYTASQNTWSGGILTGLAVLNNGVDVPQYWPAVDLNTRLADLPNWPANLRAASLRPFQNYLVALDLTEGGTRYPTLLRWSHPADPNAVPLSWDIADPTRDAGQVDLAEGGDALVDCRALGAQNIVYKGRSTWAMRPIGGPFVFGFTRLFSELGLMGRFAHTAIADSHILVTEDDIVRHNGVAAQSILDRRLRRYFFNSLNVDAYRLVFVAYNPVTSEVVISMPDSADGRARLALVWNSKEDSLSVRELPEVTYMDAGLVSTSLVTWDSLTQQTWNTYLRPWDAFNQTSFVLAAPAAGRLYALTGNTAAGQPLACRIERTGLLLDYPGQKRLRAVWPRLSVTPREQAVNLWVGIQNGPLDPVRWQGPYPCRDGAHRVPVRATARWFGVALESQADLDWRLHGLSFEFSTGGLR